MINVLRFSPTFYTCVTQLSTSATAFFFEAKAFIFHKKITMQLKKDNTYTYFTSLCNI